MREECRRSLQHKSDSGGRDLIAGVNEKTGVLSTLSGVDDSCDLCGYPSSSGPAAPPESDTELPRRSDASDRGKSKITFSHWRLASARPGRGPRLSAYSASFSNRSDARGKLRRAARRPIGRLPGRAASRRYSRTRTCEGNHAQTLSLDGTKRGDKAGIREQIRSSLRPLRLLPESKELGTGIIRSSNSPAE